MQKNILSDFAVTFFLQIAVAGIGVVVLKILAMNLSEEGLGAYLVGKRVISFLAPLVTINLSMSLARFVSLDETKGFEYFSISFAFVTIIFLFIIAAIIFLSRPLASLLFDNTELNFLIFPLVCLLYATALTQLCSGYFRGKREFLKMNLIDLVYWIVAIGSLILLFIRPEDNFSFLKNYFILFASVSVIWNIYFIYNMSKDNGKNKFSFRWLRFDQYKTDFGRFIRYGMNRLPQGLMMAGIFFIPVFIASKSFSLSVAAYIGIMISIISVLQILVYPFNLIFVPKFSFYQSQMQGDEIKKYSQLILEFCLTLPFLAGIFVFFLTREMILIWFGDLYEIVIDYFLFVGPLLGFYLSFVLIRGILDGLYDKPYVNYITLIAFSGTSLIALLSAWFRWELGGLTAAISIGMVALGTASVGILIKKQKLKLINLKNILSVLWLFGVGYLLFYLDHWIGQHSVYFDLIIKSSVLILLFIISIALYLFLRYEWIDELINRVKTLKQF